MPSRDDVTTQLVRQAVAGDGESLDALVTRFSPALLVQARHRLGPHLRELYDPEDLVAEVWAIALPRLESIVAEEGRRTAAVLAFLGRTLLHRVNNLVQRHIVGKPVRRRGAATSADPVAGLAAAQSGVITAATRRECRAAIVDALVALGDADRELVILRGIEQHPVPEIAVIVGTTENNVSARYRRALAKLRRCLPRDLFDDLPDA